MMAVSTLRGAELVEVWERGKAQHPVDRALTVLAACSDETWGSWARASVGRRDAALLAVYETLIGRRLDAFAECPGCAERLEYSLAVRDLLSNADPLQEAEFTLQAGDVAMRLRLPTSFDLAAVATLEDPEAAAKVLAERCILEARQGSVSMAVSALPDDVVEAAGARIASADPIAELLIDLACSACGHAWQVLLDIESFLWAKLSGMAKRLLREVHVLARAYGWYESDILSMSSPRRQFYLEMVS